VVYRQFLLDINENKGGNNELLSLNQIQIFQTNADRTGSTVTTPTTTSAPVLSWNNPGATAVFRLNNAGNPNWFEILLNFNLNPGSGAGDMFLYVRDSDFDSSKSNVILYSQFGAPGGASSSSDGFEEWSVLKAPGTPPISGVPEPSTIALAVSGLVGFGAAGLRRGFRKQVADA